MSRFTTSRAALIASIVAAASTGTLAPSASAALTVDLKVSSAYAFAGFPITVTVKTTGSSGKYWLEQTRPNRILGPGRCSIEAFPPSTVSRVTPSSASNVNVIAGETLTLKIQPSSLKFAGGNLFAPPGWNSSQPSAQDLCWDQLSQFNRLRLTVVTPTDTVVTSKALTRVI